MSTEVICFSFCTYTASFYGTETWYSALRQRDFDKVGVVYHRAVKKTVELKNCNSNHVGCQVAGVSIFRHLPAKRYLGFMLSLLESSSPCLTKFKYFFQV